MAIEIYWGSGSPFSWRVLLAAEIKGVEYVSHQIEFSKNEHKTAQYLAMNPRGKVPVLRDGDFALSESLAIMFYLDRRFPEPALFGDSGENSGRIMRMICDCMLQIDTRIDRTVLPFFRGTLEENLADAEAAAAELAEELSAINARLAEAPWLVGAAISAADIFLYPGLQLLERVMPKMGHASLGQKLLPLPEKFPNVGRWEKRIEALPFYDKTYPPHWKA